MTKTRTIPRLLVVNDKEANRYAVSRILSAAGLRVEQAATGRQALDQARAAPPDLVVLDVKLPDIGGLEVCQMLKADPVTAGVPVLHLSATRVEPEDQARGLESGADGYLTEPVDPAVLLATVRALLRARRAEQALRESEERFRTMADGTPLVIWVTDADGQIRFINRAYCEFFGTTLEAVQEGGWEPLVHPEDAPAHNQAFRQCLIDRKPFRAMVRVRRADGAWRWVDSTGAPRFGPTGEFLGMAGSSPDVTERELARQDLARSNEELEQFASIVSHDLRSPMMTLSGCVQLLSMEFGDRLSENAQTALDYLRGSVTHMDRLIGSLLNYARVGRGAPPAAQTDMQAVLSSVLRELTATLSEAGAEVTADPLPVVQADSALMGQLLQNLIENAIKYRAERPPRIHVTVVEQPREWVFSVRDNGIGIAPEHREGIFGIFQRLHADESKYAGLGVGLATCKRIVERHGGRIWVESTLGEGCNFLFSVPRHAST